MAMSSLQDHVTLRKQHKSLSTKIVVTKLERQEDSEVTIQFRLI